MMGGGRKKERTNMPSKTQILNNICENLQEKSASLLSSNNFRMTAHVVGFLPLIVG